MVLRDVFIVWQDLGLFLYAIAKAFLPLPSLEVILTPLCLYHPDKWIWYSLEGALGTCIGGAIGYFLAYRYGRKAFAQIVSEQECQRGEALLRRHGLLAVFIGGVTPIPDFLLAYLAGFVRMPFLPFTLCDGGARLLRSLLVTFGLKTLGKTLPVDTFGMWLSLAILFWMLWRWWRGRHVTAHSTSKK